MPAVDAVAENGRAAARWQDGRVVFASSSAVSYAKQPAHSSMSLNPASTGDRRAGQAIMASLHGVIAAPNGDFSASNRRPREAAS